MQRGELINYVFVFVSFKIKFELKCELFEMTVSLVRHVASPTPHIYKLNLNNQNHTNEIV